LHKIASAAKITLRTYEQSNFARTLDHDEMGLSLRKKYFGIPIEQLTQETFEDLSKLSLASFKSNIFLYPTIPINRLNHIDLDDFVFNSAKQTILIRGKSGSGKTVLMFQAMEELISKEIPCFWISGEMVERGQSPYTLLHKARIMLNPTLDGSLDSILTRYQTIVLFIDDITRMQNPIKLFHNILSWSIQAETRDTNKTSERRSNSAEIKIVCNIGTLPVSTILDRDSIDLIFLEFFTAQEIYALLDEIFLDLGVTESKKNIISYSNEIEGDPLLLAILIDRIKKHKLDRSLSPNILVGNLIDEFIHNKIEIMASELLEPKENFVSLLDKLAEMCIFTGVKQIKFEDVKHLSQNYEIDFALLKNVVKEGEICYLNNDNLQFRHDRLLHFLQKKVISRKWVELLDNSSQINISEGIFDPFYRELLGEVIYNIGILNENVVEVMESLPWLMAEVIKHFKTTDSTFQNDFVLLLKKQIKILHEKTDAIFDDMVTELWSSSNRQVVEILDGLPNSRLIDIVRMKHGDFNALLRTIDRYFEGRPKSISNGWVNVTLDYLKNNSHELIATELQKTCFHDLSENLKVSWFIVCGHFNQNGIPIEELYSSWNRLSNQTKSQTSVLMLWLLSQASVANFERITAQVIKWVSRYSQVISNQHENKRTSFYHAFTSPLINLLLNENVTALYPLLVSLLGKDHNLEFYISGALSYVDDPDIIENLVRYYVKTDSREIGGIRSEIVDNLKLYEKGRNLSGKTQMRLKELWSSKSEHPKIRQRTFNLWRMGVTSSDLGLLISFDPPQYLHNMLIATRAQLGDPSTVPEIYRVIQQNQNYIPNLQGIWSEKTKDEIIRLINSENWLQEDTNEGKPQYRVYGLLELLKSLPRSQSEKLLAEVWSHVSEDSQIIDYSLRIAEGELKILLNSTLIEMKEKGRRLYSFVINYSDDPSMKRTINRYLENVKNHLELFSDGDLSSIIEVSRRSGFVGIDYNKIKKLYTDDLYLNKDFPDDDYLIKWLNDFIQLRRNQNQVIPYEFRNYLFVGREIIKTRIWEIALKWYEGTKMDWPDFEILTYCAQACESREALKRLKQVVVDELFHRTPEYEWAIKDTEYYIKSRSLT